MRRYNQVAMLTRRQTKSVLALAVLLGTASGSQAIAQQSGSNSSDKTPPAQNQDQGQPPADSNAFPQADSEKAARQAQQDKKDTTQPPAAGDQQQGNADGSGGDSNAFPEAASRKAADDANKAKAAEDGAGSASGVSSSGDYDTKVNGRNVITPNVSMSHIHGKDPLKEDVQVGSYYLQSGNFTGAYSRFKEASTLHPESVDAIFGLAEAARHLHKDDEALSNYKLFLDIEPTGSKAKDARKALATLEKAH